MRKSADSSEIVLLLSLRFIINCTGRLCWRFEVDGFAFHENNPEQLKSDEKKKEFL